MTITVNVGDENDESPDCTAWTQIVSLAEDTAASQSVATVSCPDGDVTSTNNVVTYSITSGNTDGYFDIDGSTGAITTSSSVNFDYETTTLYTLKIKALDSGTLAKSSTATVYVSIDRK